MSFMDYYKGIIEGSEIQKQIPEYIYKFCSLSDDKKLNATKLSTLRNENLWFAAYSEMNDPFEFKGMFMEKSTWEDYSLRSEWTKEEILNSWERVSEAWKQTLDYYYVASLTALNETNLPMWAHYANNHNGYCVKYKVKNKERIYPIFYETNRIDCTVHFGLWALLFTDFVLNNKLPKDAKDFMYTNSKLLYSKYIVKDWSWAYEQEIRVLKQAPWLKNSYDIDYIMSNIPKSSREKYMKDKYIHAPEPKPIGFCENINEYGLVTSEIFAGCNCSRENKTFLRDIARELNVPFKVCVVGKQHILSTEMIGE